MVKEKVKKEIDNRKVLLEYSRSQERLRRKFHAFIDSISKEQNRLANLKKKFILNDHNEILLNSRNGLFTKFKGEIIKVWGNIFTSSTFIDS